MSDNALFRDLVRATALGKSVEAQRLQERVHDADREALNIYVTAVFFGAVGHRFEEDHSQAAITKFANEMRDEFPNGPIAIKPLVVEGLIRAVFGEEHFLDEISPEDQVAFQYPIIRKIVGQSAHMQERLEDYLTDAATLADQWTSEE